MRSVGAAVAFDTGRRAGSRTGPGSFSSCFRLVSRARASLRFRSFAETLWFMYDEQTVDHAGPSGGTPSGVSAETVSVRDRKRALRREKIALRRAMSAELRSRADEAINRRLLEIVRAEKPSGLVAYVSDGTEPDLTPVLQYALQAGIPLCLPRFEQDGSYSIVTVRSLDFPASHWGIPEPAADSPAAPPELLAKALWLVPGVAFDREGGRLGRGKGIYDRFLAGISGTAAGIAYDCQITTAALPMEKHDRPLELVVTESALYRRNELE